ncbi:hypothetical protein [Piscinibacter koreensis]|uniref:Protein kinase domain-containing protein n=1 Tax=Piscinibacter koreensis TaxID=2742824 RepID=A0A7Y6NRF9_9BURK|nr:hypothetical protein [Schlegelella koreensis]NUZ07975.1 hypothetical protein [Schlegelella koreensis]
MNPADIDRVFGRGRLRMATGEHVEVFREAAAPGERRRYTKRFLATPNGDFRPWTEREWRILARLVGHGVAPAPEVVQFDRGGPDRPALVQTYDAGITVDHWVTLLPVERGGRSFPHVFEDCAHWWALARHVLVALDAIHQLNLVHLDLKADNVCIPYAPADFDPRRPGQVLVPRFDALTLIDFAFSLVSGEPLTSPLPIARQVDYEYQSPRLLQALAAGSAGDLGPTRELDWRCDFFSLAAMLRRLLPPSGGAGWNPDRRARADGLLQRLLEVHDAPRQPERPHAELIAVATRTLADADLAESLPRGWSLATREDAGPLATAPTPITRIALPLRRHEARATAPEWSDHGEAVATAAEWSGHGARATGPERSERREPAAPAAGDIVTGGRAAEVAASAGSTALPAGGSAESSRGAAGAEPEPAGDRGSGAPADAEPHAATAAREVDAGGNPPDAIPAAGAESSADENDRAATPWRQPMAIDPLVAAGRLDELDRSRGEQQRRRARTWRIAAALAIGSPLSAAAWFAWHAAERPGADRNVASVSAKRVDAARAPADTRPGPERQTPGPERQRPTAERRTPEPVTNVPTASAVTAAASTPSHIGATAPTSSHIGVAASTPSHLETADVRRVEPRTADAAAADASRHVDAGAPARGLGREAGPDAAPPTRAPSAATPGSSASISPGAPAAAVVTSRSKVGPADTSEAREAPVPEAAPRGAAPAPPPAADFAARGNELLAREIPRIAQRAERAVLRVLFVAGQSGDDSDGTAAIRAAARALPRAHDLDGRLERAPREARALNEAARLALNRNGDPQQALRMQLGAFGANPLDPEVVGNTAFLLLRQPKPDPERARELALHALTLREPRFPAGRLEDWTTFAIASALTGRERDARNAWFVTLALTPDLERHCRGAIHARSIYGDRLRTSVAAMLDRAQGAARARNAPSCEDSPPRVASSRSR